MAKKRTGSMVGDEVEPGPGAYEPLSDEELGKSRSSGVTLKDGEWAELERIASEHGLARNAVTAWAIRNFIKGYRAGEIELPVKSQTTYTLE